jgi:hypothetical protein
MTRFHLVPQIDKRARFTMQIPEIGVLPILFYHILPSKEFMDLKMPIIG